MSSESNGLGVGAYRDMVTIREFEEECLRLAATGAIRGAVHLCAGQEAVAVGVCAAMRAGDALSFTYRSHGWALARGISPLAVFAECFGREAGCSLGRGGSKHLGDWDKLIFPSNAIVAAGLPHAAGAAFSARRGGSGDIAVAVLGDGAINQAVVHETLTLAAMWQLPLVVVCENNRYGELTPAADTLTDDVASRVSGYGIPTLVCDGMDVDAVHEAAMEAVERGSSGNGPTFIEAKTYRYSGHFGGDPETYRSKAEVEEWRGKDPIKRICAKLEASIPAAEIEAIRARIIEDIARAAARAQELPEPASETVLAGTPGWTEGVA